MFDDTRKAALRAYGELRARGRSDPSAFSAAVGVFLYRFPEMAGDDASFVVADWICESLDQ